MNELVHFPIRYLSGNPVTSVNAEAFVKLYNLRNMFVVKAWYM